MRVLVLVALIAACASPEPTSDPDDSSPTRVVGTLTAIDLEPMAYDGDALLELATDAGPVTVRVPARMNLCEASGLDALGILRVGDTLEVRGARGEDGSVTPCVEPEHQLVVTRAEAGDLYRGVFTSGFETSAFSPCDQPDAQWWLDGNEAFYARLDAVLDPHDTPGGRGARVYVEATVVGDLTDEGDYGHLGQYTRRITVTETRDMVFLAANPDSTVSCR